MARKFRSAMIRALAGGGGAQPAWVLALTIGQWYNVPNTTATALSSDSGAIDERIMRDYNGVVAIPGESTVVAFGGGHGGSNDNVVIGLNLGAATPGWSVACQPTPSGSRVSGQYWWGSAGSQKPSPPHTYGSGQFSAATNRIIWYAYSSPWPSVGQSSTTFNISFDWATKTWVQPGSANDANIAGAQPTTAAGQDASGNMYCLSGEYIYKHAPASNVWTTWIHDVSLHNNGFCSVCYDSTRNRLFRYGEYGVGTSPRLIDIAGVSVSTPTFTGSGTDISSLSAIAANDSLGMCYDPINDRYIVPTGTGGAYYAINASTFAVTYVASPGGDTPANKADVSGGVQMRIHYLPGIKCIAYVPTATANVSVMRLQ